MSPIYRRGIGRTVPILLSIVWQLLCQRAAMGASPLLFATALGGSQSDTVRAIATDASKNIYVVGETYSADFPGSSASSPARRAGDAFIVKLNSSGTQILYSVVLSGASYESVRGVAVDSSGNAYVTGVTTSADFPVTAGAFQRSPSSPWLEDAFVAKLSPTGALVYATYLGGSSSDLGYAIAIDQTGAAYVAGSTNSVNFPTTGSAPQRTFKGGSDCFVAKLDPAGATLSYSSYLGGESFDVCKGIAVDASGAAFVTGTTISTGFPLTGALKQTLTGGSDAFLTKISPGGDRFLFSTYLGGEGADDGNVVRVDSTGAVYIAGDTTSTGFPVTSGALQGQYKGGYDGFVCEVANDGSRIVFATYLGGSGADSINDLFVGQDGRIGVAGYTSSVDFPVVQSFQNSFGGQFDAFVAVVGAGGKSLDFASYLGGGGDDRAYGVAPLGSGQLVVAGQVLAGTVPYLQRSFSSAVSGNQDGFLAGVTYSQPPSPGGHGSPTLFLQNQSNNGMSAWFMGGPNNSAIQASPWFATAAANWKFSAAADMNGDGVTDLIFQNTLTNQVSIWFMSGMNGLAIGNAPIIFTAAANWQLVAAEDMNGDTIPDLILQNSSTNQVGVWFMNAGGMTFSSTAIIGTVAAGWRVAGAADIDLDGIADLLFQNQATNQVSVWFMNPGGLSYSSARTVATPSPGWTLAGVNDFNRDGVPDYVFQNFGSGGVSVWYITPGTQGTAYSSAPIIAFAAPGWYIRATH